MAVIDSGASTASKANVDSGFNLKVTLPAGDATTSSPRTLTGFAATASRLDEGTKLGYPLVRAVHATQNKSQQNAQIIPIYTDNFNVSSGVNSFNYMARTSTLTVTTGQGYFTLNAGTGTNVSSSALIQTYRYFPLLGNSQIRAEIYGYRTTAPQANEQLEFGLFNCSTVGATAATDGIFYRFNAAGELRGVMTFNGTETQTAAMTAPSSSGAHEWRIDVTDRQVEYWIDGVCQAIQSLITDAPTQAAPIQSMSVPFTARYFIASSGPVAATQFKIADVNIYAFDWMPNKPWADQQAAMGMHAYQAQNGAATYGTIQSYGNVMPTAGVASNTAANLGAGLGGNFINSFSTIPASTDVIISSFQNPLGSVNQQPRTLYIYGVSVDTSQLTVATNASLSLQWGLAFGHNAVSLATSTNSGTGVTGANRIALGYQFLASTATAGASADRILQRSFATPIPVLPGQFIQVVARNTLAANNWGQQMHAINFDGYFE